jgi:2-C-methyl-D-erythritol 2,4-cyclodiphosphate synthase
LAEQRVGTAFDAHRLVAGRPLVLGGVTFEHPRGLDGHSDADIVCHALTDALLGAAGAGDIGEHFPPSDASLAGIAGLEILRRTWGMLAAEGWGLVNVDAFLVLQEPRIAPHRDEMRRRVAGALDAPVERVSIRATTTDGLGFTGRGEGAACHAVALIERV